MTPSRSFSVFGVAVLALVALALARHDESPAKPTSHEMRRIRAHIAGAEELMADRHLSALTESQRAARERLVATLARYREEGRFPHNHDFPAERVPYFVDEHGTLCAVGYLIASTGRWELVRAVQEKMNNARVHEIANDPELGPPLSQWLTTHGMTLEEAAAIQPAYMPPEPEEPRTTATNTYRVASLTTHGASAIGFVANTIATAGNTRSAWPFLSILSGATSIGLSIPELDERGNRRTWAFTNMGVGVASLIAGTVAWMIRPEAMPDVSRIDAIADIDTHGRSRYGLRVSF